MGMHVAVNPVREPAVQLRCKFPVGEYPALQVGVHAVPEGIGEEHCVE